MLTINEQIKTSRFDSSQHRAFVNLLYTYHFYNNRLCDYLREFDLLPQHYNILRIIKGKHPEPVTPGYIIDVMLDKKSDVTRLIDKLISLGFLTREKKSDNRRFREIFYTDSGIEMFEKINKVNDMIEVNLTDEESIMLSELLDKMRCIE